MDRNAKLWDVETGMEVATLTVREERREGDGGREGSQAFCSKTCFVFWV